MIIPERNAIPFLTRKAVEIYWKKPQAQIDQQPEFPGDTILELPGGLTGPAEKLFDEEPGRLLAATSTAFRRYHRRIGLETGDVDPNTQQQTELGRIRAELASIGNTATDSESYPKARRRAVQLAAAASVQYQVSELIPQAKKR